jgi:3-phenylpropionate/trans-cinnamate dioxygenase ferredoxin subunit
LALVKVADTSEIPVGKMKAVQVGEKPILIASVEGMCHAMGNKCTHAGGDLSSGAFSGSIVTCPRHGEGHSAQDWLTGE